MGKPSKNRQQEVADTIYWCHQVCMQNPEMNDADIVRKLWPDLEVRLTSRNFGRWRSGVRAMNANDLKAFVIKARACGLLSARRKGGLHLIAEQETRLNLGQTQNPSELAKSARRLCAARDFAAGALKRYVLAMKQANHLTVFELPFEAVRDPERGYDQIDERDIEGLVRLLNSHVFVQI